MVPYGGHSIVVPQSICAMGADGSVMRCFPGPFGRWCVIIERVARCRRIVES